jgi:branched-chain amino acid transport system substrate-binding protein
VLNAPHTVASASPFVRNAPEEMMRRSLFSIIFALSTGCAAFYHLDDYRTGEPNPASPPPSQGSENAAPALPRPASSALILPGCQRNADCTGLQIPDGWSPPDGGPLPAVCIKAAGACAPLLTADCPRVSGDYSNDDAVLIGAILASKEDGAPEQAAVLAAEEISAAGSRPVVVVGCGAPGDAVRSTQHLVDDLHVAAIVGPTVAEDVVNATQQVSSKGDALIMTPASTASALSRLADDDLTWRDLPSDDQRAKLVIEQITEIETVVRAVRGAAEVKLGIVYRGDAMGMSARDSISGKLVINGHFITDPANASNVSIDSYPAASDKARQGNIATKYGTALKPDIVFITAPEQVANVVAPLEQALTAARAPYHPYYVCTDAAKTRAFLDAIAAGAFPPDIRRRVRGVGIRPDNDSAPILSAFEAAFTSRYGAPPTSSAAALSYDATYSVAYALAATSGSAARGARVAQGLRALAVGDAFAVGARQAADVLEVLATGRSVSLRGTFSQLQWDSSGDLAGGTVEVWCVGTGATPSFGSSGLTMDVRTQVVAGAFVQCQ